MSDVCKTCGHEFEDGRCPVCPERDPWKDGLIPGDDLEEGEKTRPGDPDPEMTEDEAPESTPGGGADSARKPAGDSSGASSPARGDDAAEEAARSLAAPHPPAVTSAGAYRPSRHRVVRGDQEDEVREVLEELKSHRLRGGLCFGIAGLAEHGKTQLMDRLRALRYREYRSGTSVVKTRGGALNIWTVPSRGAEHKVVDVSGEDFVKLGLAAKGASDVELAGQPEPLHETTRAFLWGALQLVEGLIVLVSLPRLWARFRAPRPASEADAEEVREAMRSFEAATIGLLKLTTVAADRERLGRKFPDVMPNADHVPDRNDIGFLIDGARRLRLPVFLGFSFADCFEDGITGPNRLFAESPLHEDAWTLAERVFPRLSEYLLDHVKYYKWDHVQALGTGTVDPVAAHEEVTTLIGAESALEFLAGHAWWLPGLSTPRWLRRGNRRVGGAA